MKRTAVLMFISIALSGCIIIPIPTREMGDALVSDEQIEQVKAGVGALTREQVIELFGEPLESYADGQVVLYYWDRDQGFYIGGTVGGATSWTGVSEHRICLK